MPIEHSNSAENTPVSGTETTDSGPMFKKYDEHMRQQYGPDWKPGKPGDEDADKPMVSRNTVLGKKKFTHDEADYIDKKRLEQANNTKALDGLFKTYQAQRDVYIEKSSQVDVRARTKAAELDQKIQTTEDGPMKELYVAQRKKLYEAHKRYVNKINFLEELPSKTELTKEDQEKLDYLKKTIRIAEPSIQAEYDGGVAHRTALDFQVKVTEGMEALLNSFDKVEQREQKSTYEEALGLKPITDAKIQKVSVTIQMMNEHSDDELRAQLTKEMDSAIKAINTEGSLLFANRSNPNAQVRMEDLLEKRTELLANAVINLGDTWKPQYNKALLQKSEFLQKKAAETQDSNERKAIIDEAVKARNDANDDGSRSI